MQSLVSLFTYLAGVLFESALSLNFKMIDYKSTIEIGWNISRDVANIFFILILLAIAIATIFRVQNYNVKSLLPKLIIIALLINFSLAIGYMVVDFTNVLASQFHSAVITPYGSWVNGILEGTRAQSSTGYQDLPADTAAQEADFFANINNRMQNMFSQITGIGSLITFFSALNDIHDANSLDESITSAKKVWANTILLSILVFVLLAAAIMLLIRLAVLMILLILSPLAFMFYILPDTRGIWTKWWNAFLSHAFFLPAFLFLLYFAISFPIGMGQYTGQGDLLRPSILLTYIVSIVMLLAALIIGKSMGIMGASAVLSVASKARRYATGFVGAAAYRNTVARAAQAVAKRTEGAQGRSATAQRVTKALAGIAAFKPAGRASLVEKQQEKASLKGLTQQQQVEKLQRLTLPQRELALGDLSPRQVAEMRHMSRKDKEQLKTMEDSIAKIASRDIEKADKIDEEIAKVSSHLPAAERGREFLDSSEKRQAALLRVSKKEDIQQIAKGFANDIDKNKFVMTIAKLQANPDNKVSPDKLNDALSVLPAIAASIKGRTTHETVSKTDFEKAAESDLVPVIDDIVKHAAPKQTGKIMERNDNVSKEYLSNIQDRFSKVNKNVDALAKMFESENIALANKISHSEQFRKSLGLY